MDVILNTSTCHGYLISQVFTNDGMASTIPTKKCKNCGRSYKYKSYLDKSWHEEKPYHCIDRRFMGTSAKFDEIFAWLTYYHKEFYESPHLNINRCLHKLKKILPEHYNVVNM